LLAGLGALRRDTFGHRAAWVLHRASGLGVLLFLLLHVVDVALVQLGSGPFDALLVVYRGGAFRAVEILLMGAVLFHAFNGVRVTVQDFWSGWLALQRPLLLAVYVLTVTCWLPAAYFMATR
jgi:succinate dehydrogenase / fumarate reductase cytochrome b subunit